MFDVLLEESCCCKVKNEVNLNLCLDGLVWSGRVELERRLSLMIQLTTRIKLASLEN